MQYLFYAIGTLLIGALSYFLRDLHRLVKTINESVTELNTAIKIINSDIKKDGRRWDDSLNRHERRIDQVENEVRKNNNDIRDLIKSVLKDHNII